jgi:hypothetical protein
MIVYAKMLSFLAWKRRGELRRGDENGELFLLLMRGLQ